jgi:GT2 family glycosyltransferase
VLASDYNGGFAYGNNLAIRRAFEGDELPDYVYLLNSDAFPDPGCVRALVEFLDANPAAGIAGSYVHGPEPLPHKTAFRFHSIWSELESTLGVGLVSKLLRRFVVAPPLPAKTSEVDWLAGASMLIRRQVLEEVGLLDDAYFMYFEETDFCLRARRAGFTTWYVVESSVTHIGAASTGLKDKQRPTPAFWFASRRHFFLKNHGRAALWAANGLYVLGASLRRVRDFLQRRRTDDFPGHLWHFVLFNFRLRPVPEERYRPVPPRWPTTQEIPREGNRS